jgi:hypothetical protein
MSPVARTTAVIQWRLKPMPRILILAGLALIGAGLLWMFGERFGLGRLPGDFIFERGNLRIYIPVATSLLLSVALSLALWLFNR